MKKILITGAGGQLGRALLTSAPEGIQAVAATREVLDICSQSAVSHFVGCNSFDGIINAAAYTSVDQAEADRDTAHSVNVDAVKYLALAARDQNIPLVHVSTDFVFNGRQSTPYKPSDPTDPLSIYGITKRDGELAVLDVSGLVASVVRTSWVYDCSGKNFLTTMLRLMGDRESIGVVADQIGTPTLASGLAQTCWALLVREVSGVFHWTDAGVASWYDFAVAIQDSARECGILQKSIPVKPLTTAQFPTPAVRPAYSVLDKQHTWDTLGITPIHWRQQMDLALRQNSA